MQDKLRMSHCACTVGSIECMQIIPDFLLSLSGLTVSQPFSQSVGRGFKSERERECLVPSYLSFVDINELDLSLKIVNS